MVRRLLLFSSLLVGLSGAAWSDTVDPFIGLDDPQFCPETGCPIFVGAQFTSNGTGGGTFTYENLTGSTITALEFQAEVSSFSSKLFSCNSVFFLNCSFTPRENANGVLLTIDFFGVNPPPPNELPEGCDSERNEFEGIPIFDPACSNQGVIAITLNNPLEGSPYVLDSGGFGGWNDFAPTGQTNVTFTTTLVTTPEPSTTILLGTGVVLMVGTRRRWRRLRRANRALCCNPLQNAASSGPQP